MIRWFVLLSIQLVSISLTDPNGPGGCSIDTCTNGGTCLPILPNQDKSKSYSCLCSAGYTGFRCQTRIDSCNCTNSMFSPHGCWSFEPSSNAVIQGMSSITYNNSAMSCTYGISEPNCAQCIPPTFPNLQCSGTYWSGEIKAKSSTGWQINIPVICCVPNEVTMYMCIQLCVGTCDSCAVCKGAETSTISGTSKTTLSTENESMRASNTTPSTRAESTIIGAVVGSVLGAVLIILLVLIICCLLKKRSTPKETNEYQGCTVDLGGAFPPAFSFDNPEYSQPPSADSKKYEQLNPTNGIKKDTNNYESLTHGDEYDNDIPSIVKSVDDAKSYDNMINKKDVMQEPTTNVSSPGNVYTDFMGNNSMTGEAENKSDSPVSGNDDTTLIDNSLYGSDKPAAETIQGNDDTILVDNSLYGSDKPAAETIQGNDDTILVDNSLYGNGKD